MLYVNNFLRVHFLKWTPVLKIIDSHKDFSVSNLVLYILLIVKENHLKDLNDLKDFLLNKNIQVDLDMLNLLIVNKILLTEQKLSYKCWFDNSCEEVLFYFLWTKDFQFFDYNVWKWFIDDFNKMKIYLKEWELPPEVKHYNSEEIILENNLKLDISFLDAFNKNIDNLVNFDLYKKISYLLKTSFGIIWRNDLWFWNFPKKVAPSWWSRHPTDCYFFDFSGIFNKDSIYYYDWKNNSLKYHKNINNLEISVNNFSYNYLNHISFQPKFWLCITSNFLRNMWRYRESRTYRVLYNDVWHIVSIINLITPLLWFHTAEYSFINEDKFLEAMELLPNQENLEKPMYFILFR